VLTLQVFQQVAVYIHAIPFVLIAEQIQMDPNTLNAFHNQTLVHVNLVDFLEVLAHVLN
jgi:hypothetical protein